MVDKVTYYSILKQLLFFSILSVILGLFYGFGIIFAIPSLIMAINIKMNYVNYLFVEKLDKALFFSSCGIVFSLICAFIQLSLIPSIIG